jgi:single-strand DNA-binding protein
MNKVMLIGNVGQDPVVRYLDNGVCVASVRLATTERGYTLQNGTQVPDRTEWHSLIFWRKQAETVEKFVHKGDKLYVEGKLQYNKWVDQSGIERTTVLVLAHQLEILSSTSVRQTDISQDRDISNPSSQRPLAQESDDKETDMPF